MTINKINGNGEGCYTSLIGREDAKLFDFAKGSLPQPKDSFVLVKPENQKLFERASASNTPPLWRKA